MKRLRGDRWIALEFKLEDLWVGAFWSRKPVEYGTAIGDVLEEFHLWICLIPCFPIHYVSASRYAATCVHCAKGTLRRHNRCDYCGELGSPATTKARA